MEKMSLIINAIKLWKWYNCIDIQLEQHLVLMETILIHQLVITLSNKLIFDQF